MAKPKQENAATEQVDAPKQAVEGEVIESTEKLTPDADSNDSEEEQRVELSVDEHNAKVSAEIAELQAQIDALKLTYKSETEKRQASLHECLTKFPR